MKLDKTNRIENIGYYSNIGQYLHKKSFKKFMHI